MSERPLLRGYDPVRSSPLDRVESGHDLVVLGAENRAIRHRLFFEYNNERIIRHASVSVAVVVPHFGVARVTGKEQAELCAGIARCRAHPRARVCAPTYSFAEWEKLLGTDDGRRHFPGQRHAGPRACS